jgi:type II secretory pathway pseudopilin PulG
MKHTEQGTTVQEVIVTLGILSILASVGGYGLSQILPNYRLSSAARSLLFHIQEARSRAAFQRTVYYLDFDLDGDGDVGSGPCVLWEDLNNNRQKDPEEKQEHSLWLKEFPSVQFRAYPSELGGPRRGPNNTEIDAGGGDGVSFAGNRIKFNPIGTCTSGTVYLHNQKGQTYAIRLRYNGLVQVWRHNGVQWVR